MGIRDDAEKARRVVLDAGEKRKREASEELARRQASATATVKEKIETWAANLGYPGQTVLQSIEQSDVSASLPGAPIFTYANFSIDDINLRATLTGSRFQVTVPLSAVDNITTLEELGQAIEQADQARAQKDRW